MHTILELLAWVLDESLKSFDDYFWRSLDWSLKAEEAWMELSDKEDADIRKALSETDRYKLARFAVGVLPKYHTQWEALGFPQNYTEWAEAAGEWEAHHKMLIGDYAWTSSTITTR